MLAKGVASRVVAKIPWSVKLRGLRDWVLRGRMKRHCSCLAGTWNPLSSDGTHRDFVNDFFFLLHRRFTSTRYALCCMSDCQHDLAAHTLKYVDRTNAAVVGSALANSRAHISIGELAATVILNSHRNKPADHVDTVR
jgi:hypothetical protein